MWWSGTYNAFFTFQSFLFSFFRDDEVSAQQTMNKNMFAVVEVPFLGPIQHHGIYTSYDNAEESAMLLAGSTVSLSNPCEDTIQGAVVEFMGKHHTVFSVVHVELKDG